MYAVFFTAFSSFLKQGPSTSDCVELVPFMVDVIFTVRSLTIIINNLGVADWIVGWSASRSQKSHGLRKESRLSGRLKSV